MQPEDIMCFLNVYVFNPLMVILMVCRSQWIGRGLSVETSLICCLTIAFKKKESKDLFLPQPKLDLFGGSQYELLVFIATFNFLLFQAIQKYTNTVKKYNTSVVQQVHSRASMTSLKTRHDKVKCKVSKER